MMVQIEVLYDLGEPYVRLEDYRAVQARAATLAAEVAAEVERLTAELADAHAAYQREYEYRMELVAINDRLTTAEAEAAIAADLLAAIAADLLTAENAALRAQLDAGEGWRKSKDVRPEDRQRVYSRTTTIAIYHAEDGYFHVDGVYGWYESEWRPAPPQE